MIELTGTQISDSRRIQELEQQIRLLRKHLNLAGCFECIGECKGHNQASN